MDSFTYIKIDESGTVICKGHTNHADFDMTGFTVWEGEDIEVGDKVPLNQKDQGV